MINNSECFPKDRVTLKTEVMAAEKPQEYIWTHIKNQTLILNCNNIPHNVSFYCIFDQINTAFVSTREFSHKHESILQTPYFWTTMQLW